MHLRRDSPLNQAYPRSLFNSFPSRPGPPSVTRKRLLTSDCAAVNSLLLSTHWGDPLQQSQSLQFSCQREKRVHVALPIRITYWKNGVRTGVQLACTYDIGPSFARVTGLPPSSSVGELLTVERGRKRAQFR